MIHGWCENKECFLPLILKFTKMNIRCFALDLPGYGKSAIKNRDEQNIDYSYQIIEYFIFMFIDKLFHNTSDDIYLLGHSLGSSIVLKLSMISYKHRIKGVILLNANLFPASDANMLYRLVIAFLTLNKLLILKMLAFRGNIDKQNEYYRLFFNAVTNSRRKVALNYIKNLSSYSFLKTKNLPYKILVISSLYDKMNPVTKIKYLNHYNNINIRLIPTGHYSI